MSDRAKSLEHAAPPEVETVLEAMEEAREHGYRDVPEPRLEDYE